MLALDSMEKQILLEKQQQQQRKETYRRITVALREVELVEGDGDAGTTAAAVDVANDE